MTLHAEPLNWTHCRALAIRLRKGDHQECLKLGVQPIEALAAGIIMGPAWAVMEGTTVYAAFGFTQGDIIWSLWADVPRRHYKQLVKETPMWTRELVALSGKPYLHNWVDSHNQPAIDWLQKSGCFLVSDCQGERGFLPFRTIHHHGGHS